MTHGHNNLFLKKVFEELQYTTVISELQGVESDLIHAVRSAMHLENQPAGFSFGSLFSAFYSYEDLLFTHAIQGIPLFGKTEVSLASPECAGNVHD